MARKSSRLRWTLGGALCSILAFSAGRDAQAAPDPGFLVAPTQGVAPERARPRPVLRPETRVLTEERVEAWVDGAVLVSRPVAPEDEASLVSLGVRRVTTEERVGHHTLYGGRYYRLLAIGPGGPDEPKVSALVGQVVRLETALRTDHRPVLLAVKTAR